MNENGAVVEGVSELALWVTDLDRSVTFYRDRLHFTVKDIDPGRNAFLKSGNLTLALFIRSDPGTPLATEYLARTGGPQGEVYHVGFRIAPDRIDALSAELRDSGLAVRGPVDFASGLHSYFLEDPDQHYIELTDR